MTYPVIYSESSQLQCHRDHVDCAIQQIRFKLFFQVRKFVRIPRKIRHFFTPIENIESSQYFWSYLGLTDMAWLTRQRRHPKCTTNCKRTVNMVYRLKMLGRGLCLDRLFKGFEREMNKKHAAKSMPCNVACPSENLTPSKYNTD